MASTLRTLVLAAMTVLYATAASPQSTGAPQAHDHQDHAAAASRGGVAGMPGMSREVMARLAALDERISMLAIDMAMFTGELKVETMAALLTALVERQSLAGHDMRQMLAGMTGMMGRMMERSRAPVATPDEEPGTMCAPAP